MTFWEEIGKPRYVVAPMVDASELAWRLLTRRHGAQLCYSPMFHSNIFTRDSKYRKDSIQTTKEDRPLIIQFCGNNPETMAAAAKLAEDHCDAIDVNLGCPQAIAKRGRYGSFLQDEWDLLRDIVQSMSKAVKIPITCKVRIFESIEKSVAYALMLQDAGCKLLTVHGRTREQKGPFTGIANWEHIRAVRKVVSIPMFSNGNIQCLQDVHRCLKYTGVKGVMSAEGILTNPALFEGINPITWAMAEEYLDLVELYPCPTSYIRGHLFKIFHKIFLLEENNETRELLATGQGLNHFRQVCVNIKTNYLPYHEGLRHFSDEENISRIGFNLILPPWICQPYIRMPPEEHKQRLEFINSNNVENVDKRIYEDSDGNIISRKKMKKLRRVLRRPVNNNGRPSYRSGLLCCSINCPNPMGGKCGNNMCKKCCKNKCYEEKLRCSGHNLFIRAVGFKDNDIKNKEINDT